MENSRNSLSHTGR